MSASQSALTARLAKDIGGVRRKRRLAHIADLLERTGSFALVAYADLPSELVGDGVVDGTDDVPRMSRRDNVWSQAVLAALAAVLACIASAGVEAVRIELYYDPKDLTDAHRIAFESVVTRTIPTIAQDDPASRILVRVERVEAVGKRKGKAPADYQQSGTAVAHHLCSQVDHLLTGEPVPRIVVRNHSEAILSMLKKFE